MPKKTATEETAKPVYQGKKYIITKDKFLVVLSLVSILGFIGIISDSLFSYSLNPYIESLWLFILGIGLLIETKFSSTYKSIKNGLTPDNFPELVTEIVGAVTVLSGILSMPFFGIKSPGFLAVKGIISVIAIVIIVIETWIVKKES